MRDKIENAQFAEYFTLNEAQRERTRYEKEGYQVSAPVYDTILNMWYIALWGKETEKENDNV